MKKHFVITNQPVRLPLQSTILIAFMLHYFKADNLWWGVFITFYAILWVVAIVIKCHEVKVDLNAEPKNEKQKEGKSKFQKRLDELMKKEGVQPS